jgi:hypothetical protein
MKLLVKLNFITTARWNQVAKIGTVPIAIHANVTYDAPGITNEIVL